MSSEVSYPGWSAGHKRDRTMVMGRGPADRWGRQMAAPTEAGRGQAETVPEPLVKVKGEAWTD